MGWFSASWSASLATKMPSTMIGFNIKYVSVFMKQSTKRLRKNNFAFLGSTIPRPAHAL